MVRPDSIRKFDMFYLACLALGVASGLMNYEAQVTAVERAWTAQGLSEYASAFIVFMLALSFAVNLLLWFLVSKMRMGWVKWVLVIFVLYSVATMTLALMSGLGSISITGALTTFLKAIAVYFLFQPDSKEWFAARES